jgi:hypothetical protein
MQALAWTTVGRIRIRSGIRIHISDQWIRMQIRKVQKHMDPTGSGSATLG